MEPRDIISLPTRPALEALVSSVRYEKNHLPLIESLGNEFPCFQYVAKRGGWHRDGGLITKNGERIATNFEEWARKKFESLGNVRAVWQMGLDAGFVGTQHEGVTLFFTWILGPDPVDFLQLAIDYEQEIACHDPFVRGLPWEDQEDIKSPPQCSISKPFPVAPGKYKLSQLTHVPQFMQEATGVDQRRREQQLPSLAKTRLTIQSLQPGIKEQEPPYHVSFLDLNPDYLTKPTHEQRILQDWRISSPGLAGLAFGSHWFINPYDYSNSEGRHIGFIPGWADGDGGTGLPKVYGANFTSVFRLMGALEKFDQETGYDFSWYFYAVHGNRVCHTAIRMIAEAVKGGKIGLPNGDAEVLLCWLESPYGF